ncbi:Phosphatidylinositol-4-phosphate 5-kinase, partial [Perkinsus sp. BL_2016]
NAVLTTRFVIMRNIFLACPSSGMDKFDLKGTTEDRYVKRVTGNEVFKDINFQNRWISLPDNLADCLSRVVEEDSEFLLRHGIMDYSLIVGVLPAGTDEAKRQLLSEAGGITVETVVEGGEDKPLNIKEKLNAQLSKVQKLFNPRGSGGRHSSRPSSVPQSDDEQDPADEPPTALSMNQRSRSRPLIQSVFNGFKDGVVGLDEKGESPVIYYVGIIDILQQYTVKKKAAHLIKRCTIGCCHEIDTVAPSYYRARFVRYMQGKIQSLDPAALDAIARQQQ